MKNQKSYLILLISFFLSMNSFGQDGPVHSPKLDKEKGFNLLQIGAKLSSVKSVLQKDTIAKKDSWEAEDDYGGISAIYLVDITKSGYSTFLGRPIARIEVYVSTAFSEDENPVVWEVKIFFKKTSNDDCSSFFAKMFDAYGGAYPILDDPRDGDQTISWYSEDVMMDAASFHFVGKKPKDDYFEVIFTSAKGG